MARFTNHNLWLRKWQAVFCFVVIVGCAALKAQEISEATSTFEVTGRVVSKTKYGFEVQTKQGDIVEVAINESTDFALRMASPWFNLASRNVEVDGKQTGDGKRERISYPLPKGKLFLLVQFRSVYQRNRIMGQASWRLNNYLVSDQPIEPTLPTGRELLLAGEVDLKTSELIIEGTRHPIVLGFRGATLRGRSIADIVPQETVVLVTGNQAKGSKTADTVLFMAR